MYTPIPEKTYIKTLKKLRSQKSFSIGTLDKVIELLASGNKLPAKYKDHQLKGSMSMYRECHIKSDLLLRYYKRDDLLILVLVEINTHSEMFGK